MNAVLNVTTFKYLHYYNSNGNIYHGDIIVYFLMWGCTSKEWIKNILLYHHSHVVLTTDQMDWSSNHTEDRMVIGMMWLCGCLCTFPPLHPFTPSPLFAFPSTSPLMIRSACRCLSDWCPLTVPLMRKGPYTPPGPDTPTIYPPLPPSSNELPHMTVFTMHVCHTCGTHARPEWAFVVRYRDLF